MVFFFHKYQRKFSCTKGWFIADARPVNLFFDNDLCVTIVIHISLQKITLTGNLLS